MEASPSNQGEANVCCAHAVGHCMRAVLQEKFSVLVSFLAVREKLITLCYREAWNYGGHDIVQMVGQWNAAHARPGSAIPNAQGRLFTVRIFSNVINNFADARAECARADALRLLLPCVVRQDGGERHAVALRKCVPGSGAREMQALNSWSQEGFMYVTPENFEYAMTFDLGIDEVHSGRDLLPVPRPDRTYAASEAAYQWQLRGAYHQLSRAAQDGDAVAIEQAVTAGANPGAAVVTAALWGQTGAVRELARMGADPDAQEHGATALMLAARNGDGATVSALLDLGATVDLDPDDERWYPTALMYAVEHGHEECTRLLLAAGADSFIGNPRRIAEDLSRLSENATGRSAWQRIAALVAAAQRSRGE